RARAALARVGPVAEHAVVAGRGVVRVDARAGLAGVVGAGVAVVAVAAPAAAVARAAVARAAVARAAVIGGRGARVGRASVEEGRRIVDAAALGVAERPRAAGRAVRRGEARALHAHRLRAA